MMENNIKYNNLHTILIFAVIMLFFSCDLLDGEDHLDRFPLDSLSPDVFMNDLENAQQAVTAAYFPWTRGGGSHHMYRRDFVIMFDSMSDDGHWRPSRGDSIQQADWNFGSTHPAITQYWAASYRSINAANYAIDQIPRLLERGYTQEQLNPYIAEAHFMRAFSYLFLVNFYGDVPLIVTPLSSFEDFEQPRTPTDQVFEQIVADLTFGVDNLPEEWPASKTGSPTNATAAAYLAKAHLYNNNFSAAESAARNAIQLAEAAGYYLMDDYESIFSIDNEPNPELLFYFSFIDNDSEMGNNYMIQRLTRAIPPQMQHIWGNEGWGYHLPQRDLYDAFEEGDPRRDYTIFSPGTTFGIWSAGESFMYQHMTYNENGAIETYERTYRAGDEVEYDVRFSETGMNVKKGIYNIGHLASPSNDAGLNVPLMRMADLYLFLAEALAEQGNTEALEWVNRVRARPSVNMPPKTTADGDLVELVRHERRVELAMEGHRLFDLVRWRKVKEVFGDGTSVKRHFFSDFLPAEELSNRFNDPNLSNYPGDLILFPIPQNELDRNSNINTQNPGY